MENQESVKDEITVMAERMHSILDSFNQAENLVHDNTRLNYAE
jgi:hypothetical protein